MSFKNICLFLLGTMWIPIYFNACAPSNKASSDSGDGTNNGNSISCSTSVTAKGSREFGMDILVEPSAGGSYNSNLQNLQNFGGSFQTYHVNWNSIEGVGSGGSSGALADPYGSLAALDAVATATNTKVTLRIHPVDVPGKFVPSDLMNTRFNSATMSNRFTQMLQFVFTKLNPSHISHIVVGNEIDGYNPGSDVNFWYDYPVFLFNLKVWLTNNYPSLQLGFVSTMGGIVNNTVLMGSGGSLNARTLFSSWLNSVDLLGVTYYPMNSNFQMQANSLVASQFQSLDSFTSKPIHIEEVGYASSAQNGGSENLQSEFFCEVFKAWDQYPSKIRSLAILRMVDTTRTSAEQTAITYGLSGNENFIEFIRSLGIRSNSNTAKGSFSVIQSELEKRGF